jgi:CPA1 family monovalent cation:H+ antiporter
MEAFKIEQLELLILVGAMVAIITRRLKIPYTTGLVVAGLLIAFFHVGVSIPLNKELMFDVLLPPLIFEAALYIQWKELRRDLLVIMTYAVLGVALSGGVCAVFMHYFAGWTWLEAMLFGALIAATDPVSIIATFKEAKVKGRLRLLVESESLFNDSTAAVAFFLVLSFAFGEPLGFGSVIWRLVLSSFGGILTGVLDGRYCFAGDRPDPGPSC